MKLGDVGLRDGVAAVSLNDHNDAGLSSFLIGFWGDMYPVIF